MTSISMARNELRRGYPQEETYMRGRELPSMDRIMYAGFNICCSTCASSVPGLLEVLNGVQGELFLHVQFVLAAVSSKTCTASPVSSSMHTCSSR